ncbi:MAG TPA: hypothetical protein VFK13_14870 [Gemmatimonadaceae bacterium]|nr:hypothetical protein [Gemmatimonadaceae bacterium]
MAYLSTQSDDAQTVELIALDLRTRRIRWRETWPDILARSLIGPVFTERPGALSLSPDGTRLFVADALQGNTRGMLVLDLATRTPVGFVPGFSVGVAGLVAVPAGTNFPRGIMLAAATPTATSASTLFLIDPDTFAIVDSIPNLVPAGVGSISNLVLTPNGQDVYGARQGQLIRIDLPSRSVTARTTTTPFAGGIAVSPDGRSVFVADHGDFFDSPGSGKIFRYATNLDPLPPVQLPTNLSDPVLVSHDVAVSADNRTLYVTSGTSQTGPLFGPQPGRLLIVDLESGSTRVVPLNDWNPVTIIVVSAGGSEP